MEDEERERVGARRLPSPGMQVCLVVIVVVFVVVDFVVVDFVFVVEDFVVVDFVVFSSLAKANSIHAGRVLDDLH